MPNYYYCSDGSKVSEATIKKNLSKAYREKYGSQFAICEGCGGQAQGSAHIIPKARCKSLKMTQLIWNPLNFFPACHVCNRAIENPKGEGWKQLRNKDECLNVIKQYDPELYEKFEANY